MGRVGFQAKDTEMTHLLQTRSKEFVMGLNSAIINGGGGGAMTWMREMELIQDMIMRNIWVKWIHLRGALGSG